MVSGSVVWCYRCGVYADKKSKGLSRTCNGAPPKHRHKGSMEGQLRKLRNCIHPKTGASLPPAVEMDCEEQINSRSSGDGQDAPPEGFYKYVAAESPVAAPSDPDVSAKRRDEFINRIYSKFAAVKAASCRGKYRIRLKGAACHGVACCEVE